MDLEDLCLGRGDAASAEGLVDHLSHCPTCQETIQTLSPVDTMTEGLVRAKAVCLAEDDPALSGMIEQLSRLPAPRGDSGLAPAERREPSGGGASFDFPPNRSTSDVVPPPTVCLKSGSADTENAPMDGSVGASLAGAPEDLADFPKAPQTSDELGRLANYRVLKLLGAGGMGNVYLAEDTRLERKVALKVMNSSQAMDPASKERFLQEARHTASIEHDHIVPIYQVGEEAGRPFLAMQLLNGACLDEILAGGRSLPIERVVKLGKQIAVGLGVAHARNLIHRDIKPANIWVEPVGGGRVKLLDFGLSRVSSSDVNLTREGSIIGTPSYMAPEQARAEKLDCRCDLYSLGCVLYRMSTGRLPFERQDAMRTLMAHLMDPPTPPHEVQASVPEELSTLIMRLLAKDPDARPASGGAVVKALEDIERSLPKSDFAVSDSSETRETPLSLPVGAAISAPDRSTKKTMRGSSTGPRPSGPGRGRWPLLAVGSVGLFAAIALGVVFFIQTSKGAIRVEVDDPDVSFKVGESGDFTMVGADGKELSFSPGEKTVKFKSGDAEFETDRFTLKKGDKVIVKVEVRRGKLMVLKDGEVIQSRTLPGQADSTDVASAASAVDRSDLWEVATRALPVERQVPVVIAEMIRSNPDYLGDYSEVEIENDAVVEIKLDGQFTDISPLRAFDGLRSLKMDSAKLKDLRPLGGMKITSLDIRNSRISDLSPIRDLPLNRFWLYWCSGGPDLAILKETPIEELSLRGTPVDDIRALEGMKLSYIDLHDTDVTDISPLQGMPLEFIILPKNEAIDVSPLKGMKLKNLQGFAWRDLSILRGMPLEQLWIHGSRILDLTPIQDAPLKELYYDGFDLARDGEILRRIKTLRNLNHRPVEETLK